MGFEVILRGARRSRLVHDDGFIIIGRETNLVYRNVLVANAQFLAGTGIFMLNTRH